MDSGVKVENAGHPGGQSLYLAMMAGPVQGPCMEMVVWTVESRWRGLIMHVMKVANNIRKRTL